MLRTMISRKTRFTVLASALALAAAPAFGGVKDGQLDLYWIDSEGGGSTLIVTPAGESVLIDAGNPGVRDPERIHRVATKAAGLQRIDHLIITHFHIDHFGGAPELATLVPIGNVWDNGLPEKDPDGQRQSTWPLISRPYREMTAAQRHVVQPGTTIPLRPADGGQAPELRCHIARQAAWTSSPARRPSPAGLGEPKLREPDGSDNANSSAWVLSWGGFRFYDGGDLTWNAETRLIWPEILVPEVDVYQVTHHGLDVSNHPRLLQALNPAVSVMNNGPTKGGMGEVMKTLAALPGLKAQYQLHRNVRPDGITNNCPDGFIANSGTSCSGEFIRCSVAPDARSYTVAIPSRSQQTRYPVRGTR